jgi:hypothetical protein
MKKTALYIEDFWRRCKIVRKALGWRKTERKSKQGSEEIYDKAQLRESRSMDMMIAAYYSWRSSETS